MLNWGAAGEKRGEQSREGNKREERRGEEKTRGHVDARPPFGDFVLQRASVDDGLKPYVSAQRRSNKH